MQNNDKKAGARSSLVGIAGPICSGKTTLVKALAAQLGFVPVSEVAHGSEYISDLHANPQRWALEAQIAFLVTKALAVHQSLRRSSSLVLDRTFAEDREIFAHYFAAGGHIDRRSLETYEAAFTASTCCLPAPRVLVICSVSLDTALMRLSKRSDAKRLLPREFVADIHSRYADWNATGATPLRVDSEVLDWREPSTAAKVAEMVVEKLQ